MFARQSRGEGRAFAAPLLNQSAQTQLRLWTRLHLLSRFLDSRSRLSRADAGGRQDAFADVVRVAEDVFLRVQ